MFFNSGVKATISFTDVSTFTSRTGKFINYRAVIFIFNSSKIIDRSDHWSLLLFKEALAIRRFKPELNHGTKTSKDLIIFN